MSAWTYIREVFVRVLIVGLLSLALPLVLFFSQEDSVWRVLEIGTVSILSTFLTVYFFGMKSDERTMVFSFIKKKIKRA
jgi:hypothetical protein